MTSKTIAFLGSRREFDAFIKRNDSAGEYRNGVFCRPDGQRWMCVSRAHQVMGLTNWQSIALYDFNQVIPADEYDKIITIEMMSRSKEVPEK